MAIETRSAEFIRDTEYAQLKVRKADLEAQVQRWVDRATQLHADSDPVGGAATGDRADILALRAALVLSLRTILGV